LKLTLNLFSYFSPAPVELPNSFMTTKDLTLVNWILLTLGFS